MYSEILEANYFVKCPLKLWKFNDRRLSSGANRKLSLPVDPGINPKSLFSCLSLFLGSVYCAAPPVGLNLIYTRPDINHINLTCSISRVRNKHNPTFIKFWIFFQGLFSYQSCIHLLFFFQFFCSLWG